MEKDFYNILGINKNATQDDISKAYRKLARKYHPDANPNDDGSLAEKFKEVAAAYEVLGDVEKRMRYDRFGSASNHRGKQPKRDHPFNDAFFDQFFKSTFRNATSKRGSNVEVRLEITLEEAAKGCVKTIQYSVKNHCNKCMGSGAKSMASCSSCNGTGTKTVQQAPWVIQASCDVCNGTGNTIQEKCPDCLGTGLTPSREDEVEVSIPAGIDTGMQIRLQGLGEPGKNSQPRGDLFVTILIKKHDFFIRKNNNLYLEVPLSYTQLVLGDEITVPTLEGKREIKIPAGTQSGTKFRIRGQGILDLYGGFKGDLIVVMQLEVPKEIDEEYLKILHQLATYEQKTPTPHKNAYNEKLT